MATFSYCTRFGVLLFHPNFRQQSYGNSTKTTWHEIAFFSNHPSSFVIVSFHHKCESYMAKQVAIGTIKQFVRRLLLYLLLPIHELTTLISDHPTFLNFVSMSPNCTRDHLTELSQLYNRKLSLHCANTMDRIAKGGKNLLFK